MFEIERKFKVKILPVLDGVKRQLIEQTYLATGKETLRVRKITEGDVISYTMTLKRSKTRLSNEEIEYDISEETYTQLLKNLNVKPLIKTRYKIFFQNHNLKTYTFDLDIYHNFMSDPNLKTVEVEFLSEEEANDFIPPEWFGDELTGDKSFANQSLWQTIQD